MFAISLVLCKFILTWIKEWVLLTCDVLDIFSKFSLFPETLASNCLFICKMIFCWQFTRLKWSRDWPRPKLKEIWSLKLQEVNVLENFRFFVQDLCLTWLYVVLNGDFENVIFFCHYFQFLTSPSPSPMDIRCNWNKRNKCLKPRLIL